ncbi:MAG: MFS transporter [Actinomycetota bacterium]|nr:MFS transporter [Actinomycetota bacterium]MED5293252.1 MFS transporter [Actinomycetota bacterium]
MSNRSIPRKAWLALVAAGLAMFLVGVDGSIVNVAFPSFRRDFEGVSNAQLSWVLNAYVLVYAALLVVSGRLADRAGRLRVMSIGLTVFVVASLGVALAPVPSFLVVMRGFQGVGAALITPASMGLVIASWPPERRATAVALWGACFAVANGFGPAIGAGIIELSNWRWAFLINLPIGVTAFALSQRFFAETPKDASAAKPDVLGGALLSSATALVVLAIVQGRDWGWLSVGTVTPVLIGIALFGSFMYRNTKHPEPILPKALVQIQSFRRASVALFIFTLGMYALMLSLVLFLTDAWEYSIGVTGLSTALGALAVTGGAMFAGPLADRYGHRLVAGPGTFICALGMLWWITMLNEQANYWVGYMPGLLLSAAGMGMTLGVLAAAGVSEVNPDYFSLAGGVTQTARQFGGALGLAAMFAITGEPSNPGEAYDLYKWAFTFIMGSSLVACLLTCRVKTPRPETI